MTRAHRRDERDAGAVRGRGARSIARRWRGTQQAGWLDDERRHGERAEPGSERMAGKAEPQEQREAR